MPRGFRLRNADRHRLNESPSEKEGKCLVDSVSEMQTVTASMKVPPKRKGNNPGNFQDPAACAASMKVPPKRKGNRRCFFSWCSMKYPQ